MKVVINVSGWVEFDISSTKLTDEEIKEGLGKLGDLSLSVFSNELVDLNLLCNPSVSNPVVGTVEVDDYDLEYNLFED
jgi:hypothetical protein